MGGGTPKDYTTNFLVIAGGGQGGGRMGGGGGAGVLLGVQYQEVVLLHKQPLR